MECPWCDEPVEPGDAYPADAYGPAGEVSHRECLVRAIVGSVGHQLGLCGCSAGPSTLDDPPGWTRHEAAAVAAKLAVDLDALPEDARPAAIADAREMVRLLGADCLFTWRPGAAIT